MTTTAKRPTKAELRELVEAFAQALNDHDLDVVTGYLTDDVLWSHPFTVEPLRGKAAVRADLSETFRSFPDLHAPVDDKGIYLSEDPSRAVVTWTMLGTMSGPSPQGFESTGRFMRIAGVGLIRFRDGLISEYAMVYDGLDYARQLGILPRERSLTYRALLEMQRWTIKARKALKV
jgi:steroid delta-isomerase-like uncharacterized protein